jgi:hypothetical protein
MGTAMALYIETEVFNRVARVIANLEPCPFAGTVTVDQVTSHRVKRLIHASLLRRS